MAVVKVSLSMPAELVEEARRLSHGNLSSFVSEGVRQRVQQERLRALVDEWNQELGVPTEEELAEAQAWLAD